MIHIYATFKGAGALLSMILGSYCVGVIADVITEATPVSLGSALAMAGAVGTCVLYLSNRLQKIDTRLTRIETHLKENNQEE
jgi:spore maturation protein SpmB